jgi:serine/threonine protein kinase
MVRQVAMATVPTHLAAYQIVSLIGTGTYGKVYKVVINDPSSGAGNNGHQEPRKRQNPEWYVLKQVPLQGLSPSEQRETVKESELMNTIGDHENLVVHFASFIEHDCLNIVMEYCAGGDLST